MICHQCHRELLEDSRFCQYCGAVLTAAAQEPSAPSSDEEPATEATPTFSKPLPQRTPTSPSEIPSSKKRFCRLCGGEVDPDTKQCTKCGKRYWRRPRMDMKMSLIILLILMAGLAVLCGGLCVHYEEQLLSKEQEILDQEDSLAAMEAELFRLRPQESYGTLLEGANAFNNFAIVQSDPSSSDGHAYYHQWHCTQLDLTKEYYFTQPRLAAQTPDCDACPHCHG